jgi:hypothetical protein
LKLITIFARAGDASWRLELIDLKSRRLKIPQQWHFAQTQTQIRVQIHTSLLSSAKVYVHPACGYPVITSSSYRPQRHDDSVKTPKMQEPKNSGSPAQTHACKFPSFLSVRLMKKNTKRFHNLQHKVYTVIFVRRSPDPTRGAIFPVYRSAWS